MNKIILYFIFLLLPFSQTFGQILTRKNFVEINPPIPSTPEWYKLNNSSDKPIKVSVDKGNVKIELSKEIYGDTHYQLSNGVLLSKNGGEFGGGLFYKPFDKTLKKVIINGEINSQLV